MENVIWNLWHGCHKFSEGCRNCYVYRRDSKYELDSNIVYKTKQFSLPVARKRTGEYKYPAGTIFATCFTSDFLLEDCDQWRAAAWDIMRERSDCYFLFITKRIYRFERCVPPDWGEGWENVIVICTCENQKEADLRLPLLLRAPIRHIGITASPLLGPIDLTPYLCDRIEEVAVSGESGENARVCDYEWVLAIRRACVEKNVTFHYFHTGAKLLKDGKLYRIRRKDQHTQAKKADIDFLGEYVPQV